MGFRNFDSVAEVGNNCKFVFKQGKFRSLNKKFICRDDLKLLYKGCLTETAENSFFNVFFADGKYILKQPGNFTAIAGSYDADTDSSKLTYSQGGEIKDEVDKLLINKFNYETGEFLQKMETPLLDENMDLVDLY